MHHRSLHPLFPIALGVCFLGLGLAWYFRLHVGVNVKSWKFWAWVGAAAASLAVTAWMISFGANMFKNHSATPETMLMILSFFLIFGVLVAQLVFWIMITTTSPRKHFQETFRTLAIGGNAIGILSTGLLTFVILRHHHHHHTSR